MVLEVYGAIIGVLELSIFFGGSILIKKHTEVFKYVNNFSYYWLCFTILTAIWEVSFIHNYYNINDMSQKLITDKEHVWTNTYTLDYVLPWKLANIFYSEYGAWADREYMMEDNEWSRIIEGTHAFLCGLFALLGMIFRLEHINRTYLILIVFSMGNQLMNSVLYMGQYFIETGDVDSVNYNDDDFPAGFLLYKRAFMYVNIFWTIMPAIVLYETLNTTDIEDINQQSTINKRDKINNTYTTKVLTF